MSNPDRPYAFIRYKARKHIHGSIDSPGALPPLVLLKLMGALGLKRKDTSPEVY
jgi:hypothetical protein